MGVSDVVSQDMHAAPAAAHATIPARLEPRRILMRLVRGIHSSPRAAEPCALAIGNFDGVHRGHQEILRRLAAAAKRRGLAAKVLLFEPQPLEFFRGDQAPARLYRLADKWRALEGLSAAVAADGGGGLGEATVAAFNRGLAEMSAADFIRLLVRRFNIQYVLVGDDFRFGKGRAGDLAMLRAAGRRYGFEAHGLEAVVESGRRVSSTWARQLLACGKIAAANELLGRPYQMSGRVCHGAKLGRAIGWPTINIALRRRSPLAGVYAARVYGAADETKNGAAGGAHAMAMDAVASIGTRPTINGGGGWMLEAHLFDWAGECYGRRVEVEFIRHLRAEEKFASVAAMAAQIERDAAAAREVLREKLRGATY